MPVVLEDLSYGLTDIGVGKETWEVLAEATLTEEAVPILDIGDYVSNFERVRFYAVLPQVEETISASITASIPEAATGMAYNMASNVVFGNTTGASFVFLDFSPLIYNGICKSEIVSGKIVGITTINGSNAITYQYNSYDYNRLKSARYVRTSNSLPAGTEITITGVRKP